jgi:hypothetical protein
MTFLPEDDQDYLRSKGMPFELRTEAAGNGNVRRGIILPALTFQGNLYTIENGQLARCTTCDVLILIPSGYATTKLDSFYTFPRLKRPDGADPGSTGEQGIFDRSWQFWSRHLADSEWRPGVDGLETYVQYIRGELRKA